jgi:hypothetical protein
MEKMSFPDRQETLYARVMNLALTPGQLNVTAQAVSKLLLTSDKVIANITVFTDKPVKHRKLHRHILYS